MEINVLWIIVVVTILAGAITGFKRGLVEETIRLVASVLGIVVLFILAKGVGNFLQGSYVNVLMALILLIVLHIFHKIAKLILKSCKLVSKLPVIHILDKLAGLVLGLVENLCFIWLAFLFIEAVDPFGLSAWMAEQVNKSRLLTIISDANCVTGLLQRIMKM